MKKLIDESLLNDVINCIVHATHPSVPYVQLNALIQKLQELENDTRERHTQC